MTSSTVPVTTRTGGGTRWCPTPEQVMLLEGMYRGGLKTPSATQIQQITARLSVYGKIQGKNVFYWFQNHKARDRQKLRKRLMAFYHQHRLHPPTNHPFLPLQTPALGVDQEEVSKSILPITTNRKQVDDELPSDQTCKLMCDCPLMTMMLMEHHGTTPHCTRVPPKTLQLFPLTTTHDLKQDENHHHHYPTTSKP